MACIEHFASDRRGVELLVFPECFLHGYLVAEGHVRRPALDLRSGGFERVLRRLKDAEQTLVFGVIEQQGSRYFNTVVVVARGELVGAYRKTYLTPGEVLLDKGDAYPTFEVQGIRFGINMLRHPVRRGDGSVAAQGARLLLVPGAEHDAPRRRGLLEGAAPPHPG